MIEALVTLLGLTLAALAAAFTAWRRAAGQREEAERGKHQAEGQLNHVKRTQSVSEAARLASEKQAAAVRQEARDGTRDHFEAE